MWLVLCSSADPSGLWAYQGLRQLGLAPLELLTTESLACSRRWEHRVSSTRTDLKITLSNGKVIDSAQIRGALNRLHAPSRFSSQRAVTSDRSYAEAEQMAFYLSWLNGLPGVVINRPRPSGLCGSWLHPSEWHLQAGRAGFRTPVYRQDSQDPASQTSAGPQSCRSVARKSRQSLIALRGQVYGGAVPGSVAQACSRLAAEIGTEMLGVDVSLNDRGEWAFAGAMPAPDLRPGGTPLLRSLAQILMQGERQ